MGRNPVCRIQRAGSGNCVCFTSLQLSIDPRERKALEMAQSGGILTDLPDSLEAKAESLLEEGSLDLRDDNENGWITCTEARRLGIASVPHDHPSYIYRRDDDGSEYE